MMPNYYKHSNRVGNGRGADWKRTYDRNRFKKTQWRQGAMKFLQKKSRQHGGSFGKNFLHNAYNRPSYKVGWTAPIAPPGKARAAQNRWKRNYFNKHGKVI